MQFLRDLGEMETRLGEVEWARLDSLRKNRVKTASTVYCQRPFVFVDVMGSVE